MSATRNTNLTARADALRPGDVIYVGTSPAFGSETERPTATVMTVDQRSVGVVFDGPVTKVKFAQPAPMTAVEWPCAHIVAVCSFAPAFDEEFGGL